MYPCPTTEEVKIYFLMVAEVVDHYRISLIFKASDCSVGFPHPTEKDEAENNVGHGSPTLRDLMYI